MTITTDASAPLIAVVGSTGLQGGSVINALAASDKPYRIRGITRDPSKPKATSLSDRGVEVVKCNLTVDNGPEIEKAFQGATYVFIVTNFWEHLDGAREAAEGNFMVDCAQKVGVKLLLISSLPNATEASNGELTKVYHFDAKAAIAAHAKEVGIPYVEVQAAGYYSNLTSVSAPQPMGDGTYVLRGIWTPTTRLPYIDTYHDYGLFVQLAIESDEYNKGDGKVVCAYSEWITFDEEVKTLSEVTGQKVTYQQVTEEQSRQGMSYAGLPPHMIDDMIDMSKFHEFVWHKVFVHTDLSKLPRQPRKIKEYCESVDWSSVFPAAS